MLRVLIVDDVLAVGRSLARLLAGRADVELAASAEQALDLLDRRGFDVIVSDCAMPGMDGLTFLARVAECLPETRRILHSASDVERAEPLLASGVIHAALQKPAAPTEVVAAILAEAPAARDETALGLR